MRKALLVVPVLVLVAAAIGLAAAAGEWNGKTVEIDGVPHFQNPAEPMLPLLTLEGKLLWSVGGDSEADEELLGAIIEIALDDEGNSYLLDTQLCEVKVFDPEGQFIHVIGQEGDGPGEFRRPTGLFYNKTAGLGVLQPMPARIVMFNTAGEPTEELPVPGEGGFMSVSEIKNTGSYLLMALTETAFNSGKMNIQGRLLLVSAGGQLIATVWDKNQTQSSTSFSISSGTDELMPVYQTGYNDLVYLSPHYDKYEIKVLDSQAGTVRVISREYETRQRSDEEIQEMKDRFERSTAGMPAIKFTVQSADRDIQEILVRDNGEIWVGSSRSLHEPDPGQFDIFEVFDPEGRYVRNVSVTARYDRERDTVFLLKDRLYVVKEGLSSIRNAFSGMGMSSPAPDTEMDELQPPEVLCYQIGYVVAR